MCGSSVIKSSMGWVQANREYRLRLGMVVAELLLGTTCTPSTAPSAAGHMQARLVHAHQFTFQDHITLTPPTWFPPLSSSLTPTTRARKNIPTVLVTLRSSEHCLHGHDD